MESLSWQAPSFHYVEKNSAWYMWSIVVAVVVGGLSLLQGNILFVFFVIIAEAVILLLGQQKPKLLLYEATETKISVDKSDYPYAEYAGFTLFEDAGTPRYHELVLTPKSRISTHIKILMPAERAGDVRALIARYLPEVAYEESVAENILKRIGL